MSMEMDNTEILEVAEIKETTVPTPKVKVSTMEIPKVKAIQDLKPDLKKKWSVKARILDKTEVKKVGKQDMFWCTLLDQTGAVNATFVNMTKSYENLENGKIYTLSRGTIQPSTNRNTSSVANKYSVSLDGPGGSVISEALTEEEIAEDVEGAAKIPAQPAKNIVSVLSLAEAINHKKVDALVTISSIPEKHETTQQGKNFRTLVVSDETAVSDLTLWDEDAVKCEGIEVGGCYMLKNARVGKFAGGRATRLVVWDAKAEMKAVKTVEAAENDEDEKAVQTKLAAIKSVTKAVKKGKQEALRNISSTPAVARDRLDEMKPTDPKATGLSDRIMEVLCVPSKIVTQRKDQQMQDGDLWFPTCSTCKKGIKWVDGDDGEEDSGKWHCSNIICIRNNEKSKACVLMKESYKLKLQICDGTAFKNVSVFDAVAAKMFGMSATDLNKNCTAEDGVTFFENACAEFLQKPALVLLKVKYDGTTVKDMTAIKITVFRDVEDLKYSKSEADAAEFDKIIAFMNKPREKKVQNPPKEKAPKIVTLAEDEDEEAEESAEKKAESRGKRNRDAEEEE